MISSSITASENILAKAPIANNILKIPKNMAITSLNLTYSTTINCSYKEIFNSKYAIKSLGLVIPINCCHFAYAV